VLPPGYATDDGTGIVYRGTDFAEAVSKVAGKGTYYVSREEGPHPAGAAEPDAGHGVTEERVEPRLLPGAA
jgi:hypothetical protein